MSSINLTPAINELDELRALLVDLDGERLDTPSGETSNRTERQRAARTSRQLLLAQHQCERLKVLVGDQFFIFRRMQSGG